ncbi:MAG TPA: MBL fold metallo-hydrolase [bacterium]|nr:MBL fold metallo-hydrolase [bacterium]
MKNKTVYDSDMLPVKIYSPIEIQGTSSGKKDRNLRVKFCVSLEDKPGSLLALSSLVAANNGNIVFFHYDRSMHSNRVVVEVQMKNRCCLDALLKSLTESGYNFQKKDDYRDEVYITTPESVLEIKVRLINRPGSLAAFTSVLTDHHANVIYMLYDEDIDTESADIALATENSSGIYGLLSDINSKGYNYRIIYRGNEQEKIEHIIGLNLIEKFFLNLRKTLPGWDQKELRTAVESSRELCSDLVNFYSELGNNLEKSEVFEKVLSLASISVRMTGQNFHVKELPILEFGDKTRLFSFRLPTTENIFVFQSEDEIVMFDGGFGLYYEGIKALLRSKSMNPSRIKRIFVSHCDADHVGTAGYFAEEFGAMVFMHPASRGVVDNENRAFGTNTKLLELNKCFTKLVNGFTKCKYPERINFFPASPIGREEDFNVIGSFQVGSIKFLVLESHGGHIPGQVFFLNRDYGLLFTADYLINLESLSSEEKDILSVNRYLMTSTNTNSQIFREESESLKNMVLSLDDRLQKKRKSALIFPGHGDYYRPDLLKINK